MQFVPQMKQVVAEKCPSNFYFNFDFVANGLLDVKLFATRVPSEVLIAGVPQQFYFDFVANGPVDVKCAIEERVLSVEFIMEPTQLSNAALR